MVRVLPSELSVLFRGKVGGIPLFRLSSLCAVTVLGTFPFGEVGLDTFSMVSFVRSTEETVEASPSFGSSSFGSKVGSDESMEYCNDPISVNGFVSKEEAAASKDLLIETAFRVAGPSVIIELESEPPRETSLEAGGDRRFNVRGEFFALPGNASHTLISIISPTSSRLFGKELEVEKLAEFKIGCCLLSSVLLSSLGTARRESLPVRW
jgi:hypothetical protein